MITVENVVLSTVQDFVRAGVLFTALDVSNKVKEDLPLARHREVRDLVRAAFVTDIEPASYAKTPITVTLTDGTTAEALLYHPLMDSWDLDAKYDAQKRTQTATQPIAPQATIQSVVNVLSDPANLLVPIAVLPTFYQSQATPQVAPKTVAAPVVSHSRALWDNLFKAQPSLFPINKS